MFLSNQKILLPRSKVEVVTERQYRSEQEQHSGFNRIVSHLEDIPVINNSKNLPDPRDTELSRQLKLGVKLDDYGRSNFMQPRAEYMNDEQAQKFADKLNIDNNE